MHLIPTDGTTDWRARAVTDVAGVANISTYSLAEGAPKGKFKVVVTKIEEEPSRFKKPETNNEAALADWQRKVDLERRKSYSLVEQSYTQAETSPLELEITGETVQTFDVGKKVRVLVP